MNSQRRREAASAAATFHVAMILLGGKSFAATMEAWQSVAPTEARLKVGVSAFLESALPTIQAHRHQVEAIAIAFMRLFRALHTGFTFQNVMTGDAQTAVPLNILRRDFVEALERYAPEALESSEVPDHDHTDGIDPPEMILNPDLSPIEPYSPDYSAADPDAIVEVLDWLEEELDRLEDDLDQEIRSILEDFGSRALEAKIRKISARDRLTPREADALREEATLKVGRRLSAHASRTTMNGGRNAEHAIGRRDDRVLGFIRIHDPKGRPDVPCPFCALLMTRGFVKVRGGRPIYKSEKSAGGIPNEQGFSPDQYHSPDHCRAEQVYSLEQVDNDPRFDMNRKFADLYLDRIKGRYSGGLAMSKWREVISNLKAGQESAW